MIEVIDNKVVISLNDSTYSIYKNVDGIYKIKGTIKNGDNANVLVSGLIPEIYNAITDVFDYQGDGTIGMFSDAKELLTVSKNEDLYNINFINYNKIDDNVYINYHFSNDNVYYHYIDDFARTLKKYTNNYQYTINDYQRKLEKTLKIPC